MKKDVPIFLSIPNTAKELKISEQVLRNWCKEDKIPYIRVGIKYMINVPQTLEKLRSGEVTQIGD
jgi:phage antirepressor YoqD-like protein